MIRASASCLIIAYTLCSLFTGMTAFCETPLKLKIGVALSLSGDCADVGSDSLKGLRLALEEINQAGGILSRQVELVVEDTKESSSVNAVTAFKKLTDNKELQFIIGPSCSSAALALAPIARKLPSILMISPSVGVRDFVTGSDNIFKLWPYDEDGPRLLAQFASKKNWRKVAIISSQQAWELAQGNFVADAVVSFGGEVVAKVETLPSEPNLKGVITPILRRNPNVIVLTNYLQMDRAAIELAKQGYKGPVLTSLMTDEKIKLADGKLENSISYGYPPAAPEFLEKFEARFGSKPTSVGADTSYDALVLLKETIVKTQTFDVEVIKKTLRDAHEFMGASGKFSLDSSGGAIRVPQLFKVVGEQKIQLGQLD
jgi:branched-chain amino acid transport system substrate-binding protein